jgi:hypothetical protein
VNGEKAGSVLVNEAQETMAILGQPGFGIAQYRAGPQKTPLSFLRRHRLIALPSGMRVPDELERQANKALCETAVEARVERIRKFAETRVKYDRKESTARAYARFFEKPFSKGWLDFVLRIGLGDCDVKNTVAVTMLRRADVPSRLAVGVSGRNGKTSPGLHAWIEYYDGGWKTADATGVDGSQGQAAADIGERSGRMQSLEPKKPLEPKNSGAVFDGVENGTVSGKTAAAVSIAAALVLSVIALALFYSGRNRRQLFFVEDRDKQRQTVADMMTNFLVHPETWIKGNGVASRKVLPVFGKGGAKISLDEALSLGSRGRLRMARSRSRLVELAVTKGALILDAADPAFAKLINELPGTVDLEEIAAMEPVFPRELPDSLSDVGRLVEKANEFLVLAGLSPDAVRPCLKLESFCRDVDLADLRLGRNERWPSRFVAVSATAPAVSSIAALSRSDLGLAAFLLLDKLLESSRLLSAKQRLLRRIAAESALVVK